MHGIARPSTYFSRGLELRDFLKFQIVIVIYMEWKKYSEAIHF